MVVVVFIKKKKSFLTRTLILTDSFIADAVLIILDISMDLAVGMLTEGTNLW